MLSYRQSDSVSVFQAPLGVASGAIVGHVIATGIAVLGGAFLAQYISEKMVNTLASSVHIGKYKGKTMKYSWGFLHFLNSLIFCNFPNAIGQLLK